MVARQTTERGRVATPLELLFDLTLVASFGVAADLLAHGIAEGHGVTALIAFTFAMLSVVWAWMNVGWFASAFDNDDWLYRLLTMAQMIGIIVLAIGLEPLFASIESGEVLDNRLLVAGYVLMRVALVVQWLRAVRTDPRYRATALTYVVCVGIAQVGWVVLAMLPLRATSALLVALVLLGIEVLGPPLAEKSGSKSARVRTPWHPHHVAERYALLVIIALGETVVGTLASASTISSSEGWSADAVVVVGAGVALSFALWWLYFLVPHAAVLEVRRDKVLAWGYTHVALLTAIAAGGAGLHLIGYLYEPHAEVNPVTVVMAIAIPVSIFEVALALLSSALLSTWRHTPSLIAVALLPILAIAAAALGAPVWSCLLIVLASPVALVVAFELGGWRWLKARLAAITAG
jgi:low temperature requirement protein LtrA